MRLIAIGDIHGQRDKLARLLDAVAPHPGDRLVFLGDYIDRGPDSCGVIDDLLEIGRRQPETVFLRGNHEQLLLDALVEQGLSADPTLADLSPRFAATSGASATMLHLFNGGSATLASYDLLRHADGFPAEHLAFLRQTRLYWIRKPFLFVHAGAAPAVDLAAQDPFTLLWDRTLPPGVDGCVQVVGHQPTMDGRPHFEPGRYRIDTGAGHHGPLTACDVLTRDYWQA